MGINKTLKRNEGFTIIEVMIVLVIAAVILLIVFLAVPALQRNSRNTQRKNDVAALLSGVNEFATNNNGSLPDHITKTANGDFAITTGTYSATNTGTPAKLGYYNNFGSIPVNPTDTTLSVLQPVMILTFRSCNGNALGAVGSGDSRSVVAYYYIEPGTTAVCQAS